MAVIGIDLGGTKIEGVLMTQSLKVLRRGRIPTQPDKPRSVTFHNILKLINELWTRPIVGIGVGTPGFYQNNRLTMIKNVPRFMGFDLKNELQKRCKVKVRVENDANCFAIAEHAKGAGKGTRNMVGLIIGTGIGGGIIFNNQICKGLGGAGEIGHMTILPGGPKCSCGGKGHFEALASGTAIIRRYISNGGNIKEPNASKIFSSGEKAAIKTKKEILKCLGIGLGNIINIFHPERIVIGGGVSKTNFYKQIHSAAKKYTYPALFKGVKIVRNKLGDSSGVIGAGILVKDLSIF